MSKVDDRGLLAMSKISWPISSRPLNYGSYGSERRAQAAVITRLSRRSGSGLLDPHRRNSSSG